MAREPIAITGIGCRFPGGANDARSFWNLLNDGVDAVSEIPGDRWNIDGFFHPRHDHVGKTYSKWGGFVQGLEQFDPHAFGISPREATFMDPQQRLALETAWEAFEDGGMPVDPTRRNDVGVYLGISHNDYFELQNAMGDRSTIDVHSSTGVAHSVAANRISYCFNLSGPSFAIDTACSSSMLAIHVACRAIWNDEVPAALAGGTNVIICPEVYISFCRANMLSPDGRCKAFDAEANGFVRAEGAAMILLRPLSHALARGDRIYALIQGTASNQDGKTNGITVPSGPAQAELVRLACLDAGIAPADVDFVEAHGTGTPVGDPIEASALGEALRDGRPADRPCLIGSVKTNIGHTESSAGVAGVIKAALALYWRTLPRSLHQTEPNPNIPFADLKLEIPREHVSLPKDRAVYAGVNSFGFGGANAHVMLSTPPTPASCPVRREADGQPELLVLSARGNAALKAAAAAWRSFLKDGDDALADVCYGAAQRRFHHSHRLSVVGASKAEMIAKLDAFLEGEDRPGLSSDVAPAEGPAKKPVFVFGGQGAQWWGMTRDLLAHNRTFRDVMTECDRLMRRHAPWSLLDEMAKDESESRLQQTEIAQPAIFAVQVALAAVWKDFGIEPVAVIGHSVGEVAAAHVAGALSLEDAAHLIVLRGSSMERSDEGATEGNGRMLAVSLSPAEAKALIAATPGASGKVYLAAENSPVSVTLAGDAAILEGMTPGLDERGVFNRFLQVKYAFHCPQMEQAARALDEGMHGLAPTGQTVPFLSTVTGAELGHAPLDAAYWGESVRQPVRFAEAVMGALDLGHDTFLEIGAHPILARSIAECAQKAGRKVTTFASLRQRESDRAALLATLGALHARGHEPRWEALYSAGNALDLPFYPFQKAAYWHESDDSRAGRLEAPKHSMLPSRLRTVSPAFEARLERAAFPYLQDHVVLGRTIIPGAFYVEMALAAAEETLGDGPCELEDLEFLRPLILGDDETAPRIQIQCDARDRSFTINSAPDGGRWTQHARGTMRKREATPVETLDVDAHAATFVEEDTVAWHYEQRLRAGLEFGPSFRTLQRLLRRDGASFARAALATEIEDDLANYRIHPTLIDACFQTLSAAVPRAPGARRNKLYLPVGIRRLRFHATPGKEIFIHARCVQASERALEGELTVYDENGRCIAEIEGFRCQAVDTPATAKAGAKGTFYELKWERAALADDAKRAAPDYLPSPRALSETLTKPQADEAAETGPGASPARFQAIAAELDALCTLYIIHAFKELGWEMTAGESIGIDELLAQLEVAPEAAPLAKRFLAILEKRRTVTLVGGDVTPRHQTGDVTLDDLQLWRAMLAMAPAMQPELTLLAQLGRRLPAVLRGEVALGEVLGDCGIAALEHFLSDSWSYRPYNLMIATAAASALARRPLGRRARILEIGARAGGVTAPLVARLGADLGDDVELIVAEANEERVAALTGRMADRKGVKVLPFGVDDAEWPEAAAGPFDMIVACDALYESADAERAVRKLSSHLAPGGLLVIAEPEEGPLWVELVLGAVSGWQRNARNERRMSAPFLAERSLHALLTAAGAGEIERIEKDGATGHAVWLARKARASKAANALDAAHGEGRRWLIFEDAGGFARSLRHELGMQGGESWIAAPHATFSERADRVFHVRPSSPPDFARVWEAFTQAGGGEIIYALGLDAASNTDLPAAVRGLEEDALGGLMSLLQAVAKTASAGSDRQRLTILTRGAHDVGTSADVVSHAMVSQAPLCGMARVVMREHPEIFCRIVDLAPAPADDEVKAVADELRSSSDENDVALRSEARFVQRLTRLDPAVAEVLAHVNGKEPYRLEIAQVGTFDKLTLRPLKRHPPGPGHIEIEVRASALNFRDVMKALGIYPTEAEDALMTGDECSGRVVAVGPGVAGIKPGDAVVAMATGSLASHVTVPAAFAALIPPEMTFAEAVTIPVNFLTAWYALHRLARLGADERVLIHAAAGGVGLAAVQIAKAARAEVFATAGSPEKRAFLRALGVEHILDSRSLSFADDVRRLTGGEGIDVVLNSLAGDAIPASIGLLRPYGRFLELGKRDIYENRGLGMKALRHNISFHAIDLGQARQMKPELITSMFAEVMQGLADKKLSPLPYRIFGADEIPDAFRYMAQAKHIGKIVIAMTDRDVVVAPAAEVGKPLNVSAKGTYLVTGGLGGFGSAVASWLVERGARSLVLMGRSGAESDEARAKIGELRQHGARIEVVKGDVSRREDVDAALARIDSGMAPLKGIVHAAMVLDDAMLVQLDKERVRRVMAPKADGAWNLHAATEGRDLDFFVMFSSAAAIFGNPGQGGYVAANAFLDALARLRKAQGQPALAVNWGAMSEVGYLTKHVDIGKMLDRQGHMGLKTKTALEALDVLLGGGPAQVAVMDIDWEKYAEFNPRVKTNPRYRGIFAALGAQEGDGAQGSVLAQIRAVSGEERAALLRAHLRACAAKVLKTSADSLDEVSPLGSFGLDSLMAVELMNRVSNDLKVTLPAGALLSGHSLARLADTLLPLVAPTAAPVEATETTAETPPAPGIPEMPPAMSGAPSIPVMPPFRGGGENWATPN